MTSMTELRWLAVKPERLAWTSFSVGLIGLLLLSLVLLVESLDPSERAMSGESPWATSKVPATSNAATTPHVPATPNRVVTIDAHTLEDVCRAVRIE